MTCFCGQSVPPSNPYIVQALDGRVRYYDYVENEVRGETNVNDGVVATDLRWVAERLGWLVTFADSTFCFFPDIGGGHGLGGEPGDLEWSCEGAHGFFGVGAEVWCVEYGWVGGKGVVATGGDDGRLRLWDWGEHGGFEEVKGRGGGMEAGGGVTRLERVEGGGGEGEVDFLVGSYDEAVRRVRYCTERRALEVLWETEVGGGVWRLERFPGWEEGGEDVWLAGIMYGGAMVLGSDGRKRGGVEKGFESMVYGAGWIKEGEEWKCVACSFYDMRVRVWDWEDK
ncbi:hypothetical protein TrCOL_g463 [Triparma columacea]|uniref:methylated diphthine methylhydrolase n=1 Tax=Triparma columacea TaxID=722753 RepID=A0A9W7GPN0_9STRA|nr:hypothetical protein TrCOL_g463 [Triparma columacea]